MPANPTPLSRTKCTVIHSGKYDPIPVLAGSRSMVQGNIRQWRSAW
ncbi:hypothetical protein ASZ90_016859 [hydrocarbon metagenome]|uniref:Uncharacterized protein n=1 Tax=hydrocarbon metagenome TaxID=938273 RepID=A0A0W8EAN5_9ZZZZ